MEPIRASEINEIIRKQIENFETGVTVTEVGTVIKVGDGIAEFHGLEKVMAGELLEFPHDVRGLALNLEEDKVGAVLFGDFQTIREGDLVKRTGRIMQVPVGRRDDRTRGRRAWQSDRRRWSNRHRALLSR